MKYTDEITSSVINSINICINVIVPSMFTFMVISSYILSSELYKIIFKPFIFILKKILNLDERLISVFLLSLIGGYPVGIKLLTELISQNKNYYEIADKMVVFCYCISPTFAVTMLGTELFGSIEAGLIVYISNVISNLILAVVYCRFINLKSVCIKSKINVRNGIIESINSSAFSLFRICTIIIFFNTIITCFECFLAEFDIIPPYSLKAFFEISNILKVDKINASSLPLIASLASIGGLCVVFQSVSIVNRMFSVRYFIISRLISAFLSFIITKVVICFWDISIPAFSCNERIIFEFSTEKAAAVFLLIMLIVLMQKSEKNFKKG